MVATATAAAFQDFSEETALDELFADWIARGPEAIQDLIDRDPATYLLIMAAIFNGAEVQERH
jgi:hypothetical protein